VAVVAAMITGVGMEEVAVGGVTCGIVLTNIQTLFGDFLFFYVCGVILARAQ